MSPFRVPSETSSVVRGVCQKDRIRYNGAQLYV